LDSTVSAAILALAQFGDLGRLAMLLGGVAIGLVIGILPGLGGIIGLTLVLPFTFHLDPLLALSLMVGLYAVVATSDSIPAILLGVPGTVGSAATVMDGYPLTQRGDAGRALSVAFASSLLGGLFGALVLAVSIPVMRPLMLAMGSPEMFMLCVLGLSLVAALSGSNILHGLIGASLGILLSLVGEDYQSGALRWTFDTTYLWSGIPLVPFALGLFALPEIADVAIRRRPLAGPQVSTVQGRRAGLRDVITHWRVVLRSSAIGSLLGALPGIGSSVIDWVAYGAAVRSAHDSSTFGRGDVRGIIASEASGNAKEGGALIPTLAFGVPGSAAMAILLGAFSIHGIVPGPDMLSRHLDITFAIVFSLVLANVAGAAVCFIFARRLAAITRIPPGYLVPIVLSIAVLGSLQGELHWANLVVFLAAGALGLVMKLLRWQRPPLLLGFVLGPLLERYLATSYNIYGFAFLERPVVIGLLLLTCWGIAIPAARKFVAWRKAGMPRITRSPKELLDGHSALAGIIAGVFALALYLSSDWESAARAVPNAISVAGLCIIALSFAGRGSGFIAAARMIAPTSDGVRYDEELSPGLIRSRTLSYVLWAFAVLPVAWLIGPILAVMLWTVCYMVFVFRINVVQAIATAAMLGVAGHILFDRVLGTHWPLSLFEALVRR
jgi:TctA family transporter